MFAIDRNISNYISVLHIIFTCCFAFADSADLSGGIIFICTVRLVGDRWDTGEVKVRPP